MGDVITDRFPLVEDLEDTVTSVYELPSNISREARLNAVARGLAELFLAGLAGHTADMEDIVDFLTECYSGFNPPVTAAESEFVYRKGIKAIKEREKR